MTEKTPDFQPGEAVSKNNHKIVLFRWHERDESSALTATGLAKFADYLFHHADTNTSYADEQAMAEAQALRREVLAESLSTYFPDPERGFFPLDVASLHAKVGARFVLIAYLDRRRTILAEIKKRWERLGWEGNIAAKIERIEGLWHLYLLAESADDSATAIYTALGREPLLVPERGA